MRYWLRVVVVDVLAVDPVAAAQDGPGVVHGVVDVVEGDRRLLVVGLLLLDFQDAGLQVMAKMLEMVRTVEALLLKMSPHLLERRSASVEKHTLLKGMHIKPMTTLRVTRRLIKTAYFWAVGGFLFSSSYKFSADI